MIVIPVKITEHVRILKTGLSALVQNNMKEIFVKQEVCSLRYFLGTFLFSCCVDVFISVIFAIIISLLFTPSLLVFFLFLSLVSTFCCR